jgi:hypothetical protein
VPLKNNNTMYPYEYAHNPELFSHTKTGKTQQMRNTMHKTGVSNGFLSKAGASAVGMDAAGPSATAVPENTQFAQTSGPFVGPLSNGPTTHWKSSYKGTIEESLTQPALKAQRPEWSLPRQAYSSKRSYFYTEAMKSFGTYGSNPLLKMHSEDAGKVDLHELK